MAPGTESRSTSTSVPRVVRTSKIDVVYPIDALGIRRQYRSLIIIDEQVGRHDVEIPFIMSQMHQLERVFLGTIMKGGLSG